MLQFLLNDHLQGYDLPSLRRRLTRCYGEVYIGEDGIIPNYYSPRNEPFSPAVALRLLYGCLEVLCEDGSDSFYGSTNKEGVAQRHTYLLV